MRATNGLVRLAVLQALACASGLLLATPGGASADPARFDIAPQPLPDALKNFAAQAKMQLLYRYDIVSHATANPVAGQLEKHVALEQMLRGTGLEAVYSGENTATIRLISTADKTNLWHQTDQRDKPGPVSSPPTSSTGPPIKYLGYIRLAQAETSEQPAERPANDEDRGSRRDRPAPVTDQRRDHQARLPGDCRCHRARRISASCPTPTWRSHCSALPASRSIAPAAKARSSRFAASAPNSTPCCSTGGRSQHRPIPARPAAAPFRSTRSPRSWCPGSRSTNPRRRASNPVAWARPSMSRRRGRSTTAGFKFAGSTDVNYEENSKKAAPDASFLVSDRFADGRLGVLVSGSYQLRKDRLNQAQTDGWIVNGGTPTSRHQRRCGGCDHAVKSARQSVRPAELRHQGDVREPPADRRHPGAAIPGERCPDTHGGRALSHASPTRRTRARSVIGSRRPT